LDISNNLLIQWGSGDTHGGCYATATITYATSFSNSDYIILLGQFDGGGGASPSIHNPTVSGMNIYLSCPGDRAYNNLSYYTCIGY